MLVGNSGGEFGVRGWLTALDAWRACRLVWLALLQTNYVLAYVACETGRTWFMHAATLVAVALVSAAGYAAWRAAGANVMADQRPSDPLTQLTRQPRVRWMSLAGVIVTGWFVIVILSMEIPILVLNECR